MYNIIELRGQFNDPKYSLQYNLVVPFGLSINIKKMRGPPKIVDSCVILSIFNVKKIKRSPKIINSCAILNIFNIKKWEDHLKMYV